jgi:hypothetical protein
MDQGLEPSMLINSSVTVVALTFTVIAFLIPRLTKRIRTRQSDLASLDIPDSVRHKWPFEVASYGDVLVYFVIFLVISFICMWFVVCLFHILNYYIQPFSGYRDWILRVYRSGMVILGIFLLALLVLVVIVELYPFLMSFLMKRLLPRFAAVSLKTLRSVTVGVEEVDHLLRDAEESLRGEDYVSTVLSAAAALEYMLRWSLDLAKPISFGAIVNRIKMQGVSVNLSTEDIEAIDEVRQARNTVAHPRPGASGVTADTAQMVLATCERIIEKMAQSQWMIKSADAAS